MYLRKHDIVSFSSHSLVIKWCWDSLPQKIASHFTVNIIAAEDQAIQEVFFNTLRPRPNGQHFADDIFKLIFFNVNVWISLNISLTFVPKGPINNTPALVQIMAWRRPGDKPLFEPEMVGLPTHICVTLSQWVNTRNIQTKIQPT